MNPPSDESGFATLDWVVVGLYLAIVLGIGLHFARRASRGTTDFILAGRSLPWWVAGTSIVATTFSSDTPLQVVKLVRQGGIAAIQCATWRSVQRGATRQTTAGTRRTRLGQAPRPYRAAFA